MDLAQPWALLALASLPVIVALHVVRPTRQTVTVASTELWREALRERRPTLGWVRLLRSLSLLALLAFALLASISLAEPSWLTSGDAHHDAVVIVDVTASMKARDGTTTRFARALAAARELVAARPGGGRMLIMSSGARPRLRTAFEDDSNALLGALAGIAPTDETGTPGMATTLALNLLRDRERGRVHLITDRAFDAGIASRGGAVRVVDVGSAADNVAITRFDVRAELGRESGFQVFLTVRNFGTARVSVPVRVTLGPAILVERELELGPGDGESIVASFTGAPDGHALAELVHDDALASDNRAYAVLAPAETRLVALYSAGNFYLDSVLAALPNVVVTRIEKLDRGALPQHAQWNDLVVVDGFPLDELPASGAFLLLDTPPPPPATAAGSVEGVAVQGTGASALTRDLDLTGVHVDRARQVTVAGEPAGLQRLFWSRETVLALAVLEEARRVVWLGFDLRQSNLPLRAAFPLLLSNAVDWLVPATAGGARTQAAAGERVTLAVPPEAAELRVRTPGGTVETLVATAREVTFDGTAEAGIYRVDGGREQRFFAVNLTSAAESNLAPRAAVTGAAAATAAGAQEVAERTLALWPYLVMLCLVILVAEWLAFGAKRINA